MAILNFQERFVEHILSGRKCHTIRGDRKYPIKSGEALHLYTGLRRKGARKIMVPHCTKVQAIKIEDSPKVFYNPRTGNRVRGAVISIDGDRLSQDEAQVLAHADGFDDLEEMLSFWAGRLPFSGQIIHWNASLGSDNGAQS